MFCSPLVSKLTVIVVSSPADNLPGYDSELGLLGLAFHPDFQNNGYFYVNYTDNNQNTIISRFSVNLSGINPNVADPNSEVILMNISQPVFPVPLSRNY